MFSIKLALELFATQRVKREGRKKQDHRSDINDVQHNLSNKQRRRDERGNAIIFILG